MSIKHAVLGLISEEPRHGYAVRAAFEERLGDFWQLNYGQVYQVLTGLEQEGLTTGSDERVGRRPIRRIFAVTAKGRDELRRWLLTPTARRRPFRDDFYVRLLFAMGSGVEIVRNMSNEEIRSCREHLAMLMDQARMIEKVGPEARVRQLFTRAAILHSEAALKALEHCQVSLEKWSASHPISVPAKPEASMPGQVRRKAAAQR